MDIHDEIVKEAYYLYEKSGCLCGRDLDNWLQAETIVFARYAVKAAPNPLSAEEQTTVLKPAKKTTAKKAEAKPKKEAVKKETKKTTKSTARKKKE